LFGAVFSDVIFHRRLFIDIKTYDKGIENQAFGLSEAEIDAYWHVGCSVTASSSFC